LRVSRLVLTALMFFAFAPGLITAAETELTISSDKLDATCSIGDTVTFTVVCSEKDAAVDYVLSIDGETELAKGRLELKRGRAIVRGALDQPGFLRLQVTLGQGEQAVRAYWGVAVEPMAIRSAAVLPEDFGRFWAQGKAELLRVAPDFRIEEVRDDEHSSTLYRVSVANIEGSRMFCWYRVPQGEGPFPAVLSIPGAGVRREGTREYYAEAGFAVLTMAVHGIGQDHPLEYYNTIRRGALYGYPYFGIDDPYRYYYRRMVLGAIRCIDFLYSRDEVDTTRVAVAGSSQGGGMSLLVASLDERIKALTANVPALCDHAGSLQGRPSGWPRLLRNAGNHERRRVMRTMAYFDAATAASRIKVPARVSAGFIDRTCAPSTVMAAFNNLQGPRTIEMVPGMGHDTPGGYGTEWPRWLMDALNGKVEGQNIIQGVPGWDWQQR
jgi:cephalosporin-C deacetylase